MVLPLNKRYLDIAIKAYNEAWRLVLPAMRLNARLKDGYDHRILTCCLPEADLWIQAASAGEAYLALSLVENLQLPDSSRILATTNTRQGMEILCKAETRIRQAGRTSALVCRWFPFDQPAIMKKAVGQVSPKLVVLLETEIWPGLLHALKEKSCPVWILNGRMTEKSFSRYCRIRKFLYPLSPRGVLAISETDAKRFSGLFGKSIVKQMPNIKFDRLLAGKISEHKNPISQLIPSSAKFLVLGSIRREEEGRTVKLLKKILRHHPDVITGLFPRHMHRIDSWKSLLSKAGLFWGLRSGLQNKPQPGQVILWDTFGELSDAYQAAGAVFVGGSLEPLGGQNFLEPLVCGVRPVIGPYWDNFFWVGEDIFRQGLVFRESSWQSAAGRLIQQIHNNPDREETRHLAQKYISARQGGTRQACRLIEACLAGGRTKEQP